MSEKVSLYIPFTYAHIITNEVVIISFYNCFNVVGFLQNQSVLLSGYYKKKVSGFYLVVILCGTGNPNYTDFLLFFDIYLLVLI